MTLPMMTRWICVLLISLSQLAVAALEFDSLEQDMHAAVDATEAEALFSFTNKGGKAVTISHVDPDCSCIGIQIKGGKLTYHPGESGVIRAKFKIGNQTGIVEQTVAIWMEGDPKNTPSTRLKVRLHIPQLVSLEPKTLKWKLGGDMSTKKLIVKIHHDEPIRITSTTSTKPEFTTEVVTIEEGRHYEVLVTPTDMEHPGMSIIRVETDAPAAKQRRQQAFVMVLRDIKEN